MLNFIFWEKLKKKKNWNPCSIFNVPYTMLRFSLTHRPSSFNSQQTPCDSTKFLSGIKTDDCQIARDALIIIIEYLPHTRHYAKYFIHYPILNLKQMQVFLSPFYKWRNQGTDIRYLISSKGRFQIRVRFQSPRSYSFFFNQLYWGINYIQ